MVNSDGGSGGEANRRVGIGGVSDAAVIGAVLGVFLDDDCLVLLGVFLDEDFFVLVLGVGLVDDFLVVLDFFVNDCSFDGVVFLFLVLVTEGSTENCERSRM